MVNKYFDTRPKPLEHRSIRLWQSKRREIQADYLLVEIEREREAFGFSPAQINLLFYSEDKKVIHKESAPWERALDDWLLGNGRPIRARTAKNEMLRIALRLRDSLEPVIDRVGDGYFNGLFIKAIADGPLGHRPAIKRLLDSIHTSALYDAGNLSEDLLDIDNRLTSIAHDLLSKLQYERAKAEEIFEGAVGLYLDERFQVTERRRMFGS
ncbi:MAG: hypothetical protein Q8Q09_22500 [Deltaproteobacteria bacterium]|nr:hypothetical protein [Deltaproteobacteria bacterium]